MTTQGTTASGQVTLLPLELVDKVHNLKLNFKTARKFEFKI